MGFRGWKAPPGSPRAPEEATPPDGEGEARRLLAQRLQVATRAARLGIWTWIPGTASLAWDGLMAELHGVPAAEAPADLEAWVARLEPGDRAILRQAFAAAERQDQEVDCIVQVRGGPDGLLRHLRIAGHVMRDGQGRVARLSGVAQDVTKRFEAQRALEASERRFRHFFEAMAEGVALHELVRNAQGRPVDYRILDVNPAFERHTGIPAERARGALASSLYAQDPPPHLDAFARVAAGDRPLAFESQVPSLGRTFRFSALPMGADAFGTVFEDISDRLRAEAELREREQTYRVMAANLPGGALVVFDRELRYLVAEGEGLVRVGLRKEAMEGRTPREVFPADTARIVEADYRAILGGERRTREIGFGGRTFLAQGVPLPGPDGQVERGLVLTVDLTERREAEQAAQVQADLMKGLLEATPDGVWVADLEGRILQANAALAWMAGRPPEDLIGRLASELEGPGPDEALRCDRLAANGADRYESRLENGLPVEVSLTCLPALGRQVGFVRDISERSAAEAALKASEDRYRGLVDRLHEGIAVVDTRGCFTFVNPRVQELLGCGLEVLLGRPATDWMDTESQTRFRAGLARRVEGRHDGYELRVRRSDGTWIDVFISAAPLLDPSGAFQGSMALIQDISDRKRAEAEILRLTGLLEEVVEHADVWLNVLDLEGRVVLWNRAAETVSGYPREMVVGGRDIWTWLYPDEAYRAEIIARAGTVLAEGAAVHGFETRIRTRSGQERTLLWDSKPLRDPSGTITGSLALGRDITESQRALQALTQAEERFRIVAEQTGQIVYDVDLASGGITWAGAIEAMTGHRPETFAAFGLDAWAEQVHPEDRSAVLEQLQAALQHGAPFEATYRFRRADGTYIGIEDRGVVLPGIDGSAGRMLGVLEDVSLQRRAEAELRETEARLRRLAHAVPVVVYQLHCRTESEWRMTFVNDRVQEVFGLSPEACLADVNATLSMTHPEDLPAIQTSTLEAFRNCAPWSLEFRIVRDGEVRWHLGASVPQRQEDGSVVFTGFFQDITERKRAEAEQGRLLDQLAASNRELETLVYVASHDLRSPLVNVMGFAQRLEKHLADLSNQVSTARDLPALRQAVAGLLEDRMPSALRFIGASGTRMDALIAGLLKVSRAGRVELRTEVLDMDRLVRGLLDALAFQAQAAGAEVVLAPLPPCRGDGEQVRQVFANLLDNALKYRDPERPLRITLDGAVQGAWAIYRVADTGIGIDEDGRERVFGLFHRLDPGGPVPGEGLGLALVQRMVERNGGRIWLDSVPGQGSTFHVSLPLP